MRVRKRLRRIKRLAYLGGIAGGIYAARQAKARREARTVLGPPATWPPLEPGEPPVAAVGDLVTSAEPPAADDAMRAASAPGISDEPVAALGALATEPGLLPWVASDDGGCPLSHPVKADGDSRIYHLPGGQFYDRTRASRCYVDAAAAEADGYRAAKG